MKDIRVHISFPTHRKTRRLIKALGPEAPLCLLRLWCFAAQHRTTGLLNDLDNFDISEESGWKGEPEDFVQALLDAKYLDDTKKGLKLHDWEQHQPFIATHKKRSEQASKAAKKRWEKKDKKQEVVCGQHESALLFDKSGNAPYPSPSPYPSPLPLPSTASPEVDACVNVLKTIDGFPFKETDVDYLTELSADFPELDPLLVIKDWKAYISDNPFKPNANHRSQMRTQFKLKEKWGECKRENIVTDLSPGLEELV